MQTFSSYVIQKIIFIVLCYAMLMLSGCGSSVSDPTQAAHDAYCASNPHATADPNGVKC